MRSRNGFNLNPTVYNFNNTIAKIMSHKFSSFSTNTSNCEGDQEEFLTEIFSAQLISGNSAGDENQMNISHPKNFNQIGENNDYDLPELTIIEEDVLIEDLSLRYFIGFAIFQTSSKINCSLCDTIMKRSGEIIKLQKTSETFLFHKNYSKNSDFGSITAPTDQFFQICKLHVNIFKNYIANRPHIKNIRKQIVETCVSETNRHSEFFFWFSDENICKDHYIKILDYIILILLKKYCVWESAKLGAAANKSCNPHPKLKIIKQ